MSPPPSTKLLLSFLHFQSRPGRCNFLFPSTATCTALPTAIPILRPPGPDQQTQFTLRAWCLGISLLSCYHGEVGAYDVRVLLAGHTYTSLHNLTPTPPHPSPRSLRSTAWAAPSRAPSAALAASTWPTCSASEGAERAGQGRRAVG